MAVLHLSRRASQREKSMGRQAAQAHGEGVLACAASMRAAGWGSAIGSPR